VCRDGLRKTKAHTELNLVGDMKGNKKRFYRSTSCKRSMREYVDSLLSRAGDLVTGTGRRLRYSAPSFPLSLLGRLAFSSSRFLKPKGMSGERRTSA